MPSSTADELLITLKKAAHVLRGTGVPFALAGGFAAYAHGAASSDHDVDFLVRQQDVDTVLTAFAEQGFRTERPPEGWLVKAWDDNQLIDLIFRPVEIPVTDITLSQTEEMRVGPISVPVISATQLMIHRLAVLDQHTLDMAPALQIARSLREKVEWDQVRLDTGQSPYAEAFLFLAERLGLIDTEERHDA